MAEDQPSAASALLENSLIELDETYTRFKNTNKQTITDQFLCDSYVSLDTAYKALVIPLSPAYLSGSNWYAGPDLPMNLFDTLVMIGLLQAIVNKTQKPQ